LAQNILGQRGFKIVQIKGQVLFKGKIITKIQKEWGHFKNLLLMNNKARKAEIYKKAF
jgi:hypothetical protein